MDGIEAVSYSGWELRSQWPSWILVILIVAAVAFAVWSYRTFANRPAWARRFMTTLRVLVLLTVLIVLFEPILAVDLDRRTNNRVVVLLDSSESMSIRDTRERPEDLRAAAAALGDATGTKGASASRIELAIGILTNSATGLLAQLGEDFDVHLSSFDEKLAPLASDEAVSSLAALEATGKTSALGSAMRRAMAGLSGQPVAGVVVLSDFAWNQGADPLEVAEQIKEEGVPIFPIGVGLVDPPDIALNRIYTKQTLFAGDNFSAKVQIRSSPSFARRSAMVEIALGSETQNRMITLNGEHQVETFDFVAPSEAGRHELKVTVSSAEPEAVTENNTGSRAVDVTDDKIRVLYVEGLPRWEYRFMRWVLLRDHRLDVRFLLTHGDPALAAHSPHYLYRFPEAGKEGLDFDLVILGDVASRFFNAQQMRWINDLVARRGGALMMVSGPVFAPTTYARTPIADLLPVRIEDGPWMPVSNLETPVVTIEGRTSGILRLADDDTETMDIWRHMRPLRAVPQVEAKPGATILMALSNYKIDGDRYPFVAWHRYGNGKTMFVASDKLWRIRYEVGRRHHERFWAQTIQFLALSRLMAGSTRVAIETDNQSYGVGERVRVFANVLDPFLEPIVSDQYTVHMMRDADGEEVQTIDMSPVSGVSGFYEGTVIARQPGTFRLLAPETDRQIANSPRFDVDDVSMELLDPGMRFEVARRMAQIAGGMAIRSAEDLPAVVQSIRARSPIRTERAELELWDTPMVFVILAIFGAGEWIMRRLQRLV